MKGFREPAMLSRREAQDALNQKMVEVTGNLTRVLQAQANTIVALTARVAALEAAQGITPPTLPAPNFPTYSELERELDAVEGKPCLQQ